MINCVQIRLMKESKDMSKILIADASLSLRTALGLILQKKFQVSEVKEATTPAELQNALEGWQPDVILLDWGLTGLPGASRSAEHCADMPAPVIALSIHAEDGPVALAAGAADFILKSCTPEQVLATVKKFLK